MDLTDSQKLEFIQKLKVYQKNPILFFQEVLGKNGHWEKQAEIALSVANHKYTSVRSGHGTGKSFIDSHIALWFLYCFYPASVITTAPTNRQVEKVLWGEIAKHFRESKYPLGGKLLETEIKIAPKWGAIGFSSDKPDAFQGFHNDHVLIIVDEPSGVPDANFEQIESIISNADGKLLMTGNPLRRLGYFWGSFQSSLFNKIHISCLDSPNVKSGKVIYPGLVTKDWVDERREKWGEDSPIFQSRVLGEFPNDNEDALIKLSWVEDSILRYQKAKRLPGPITYSVDVARQGKNKTVHILRQGRRIIFVKSYQGYDLMATVGEIQQFYSDFPGIENIIIDDNGVGGGVTDRLIELGFENVVPINAGANAQEKEKYYNRRSEMAWRVREAFRLNELDIPDVEQLVFECTNQFYDHTSDFRVRVMSKKLLKSKGLESPDFFDSLALSFALEAPRSFAVKNIQYQSEFIDRIHIVDLGEYTKFGVTRYCVLNQDLNGSTTLIWACADKKGLVYVEREEIIERATSSSIAGRIALVESELPRPVQLRYSPKIYTKKEDINARYNLIEQLGDYGYFFEELEFNEELAGVNLREGLKFNVDESINNLNHPYILFHPSCTNMIRSIKYYSNPNVVKNNPLYEMFHEALGVLILTEPRWIGGTEYAKENQEQEAW